VATSLAVPGTPQTTVTQRPTLVAHFERQLSTRPDAVAMHFRAGTRWAPITWRQFGDAAQRMTAMLVAEGVGPGEHVAVWASNRPEWHIADAGILRGAMCPVPVYLTLSPDQAAYVLDHSETKVAFVENAAVLDKVLSVRDRLAGLRRVIVMEGLAAAAEDGFVIPWSEALSRGSAALEKNREELGRRSAAVRADDVATLIYTSGTTGPPKAVRLTHRNVLAAAAGFETFIHADAEDRVLSYLPLAHIAERLSSEFRQHVYGNATWFGRADHLVDDLREVRPTLFFGVPRIWEKMAASLRAQVDRMPGVRGWLARWAVHVGTRAAAIPSPRSPWLRWRHRLADRLVLHNLRAAVGLDQARILASGAAPIAADVLRFFEAIGMPVLEVYGQTEDTGCTTMNRPGMARIGTVGQAVPGVEIRIADDGEILVRGDVVFAGYHKDEAATAEALRDGWLQTGDVGEVDSDGYLRITDRKKDLIITAGGKNIAPSNIETALKRHRLVGNAVAIGDRRPYVTALLTLDEGEARAFAQEQGSERGASLTSDRAIRDEIQRHVDEVNKHLSNVEAVKRWTLLDHDFTVGDELTPTLKVRRNVVVQRHADAIETNYSATN
jgi:long-chain acyl-CoA synthetase